MTAPFRAGDMACPQAVKSLGEKLAQDLAGTEPPSSGHLSGRLLMPAVSKLGHRGAAETTLLSNSSGAASFWGLR